MLKSLMLTIALAWTTLGLAGCASPPIVNMRTTADLNHRFSSPSGASVAVAVWRASEADRSAEAHDAPPTGRIVPTDKLSLEERNFLAGVQAGLKQAGFDVVEGEESATYTMLASVATATGMYDTYRRVPVMESTTGYVHTHHGLRSYTATTTSDYIVPERRPYVHRIVTLSALPGSVTQGHPDDPGVVWRGRMVSDADVIDADLAHHVATLLESWGASAQRDVKYRPED